MSGSFALGIDLGGSKIYAVVTDSEHRVIASAKTATNPESSPEDTAAAMRGTAEEALSALGLEFDDIGCFGAAVPSPVDPVTGDCLHATNLAWKKASMRDLLQKTFGRPFALGNDANLGLLGEHFRGAAKGFHSSVGYFIGTGLGGGIILDDRLLLGNSGLAGELGHAIVRAGGRRCGCGHRGCAEAYCSKIAFVRALRKEIFQRGGKTAIPPDKFNQESRNIKSKYLARAYQDGEAPVRKVIDKGLRMLGVAAASTCATVAPECIVIGGGFAEAMGEVLLPPFLSAFRGHLFGIEPEKIAVRLSVLGDNAVAVGATILARSGDGRANEK